MIETVESFVQANRALLTWAAVAGWAISGSGMLALSFRSRSCERLAWLGSAASALLFAVEMACPLRYTLKEQLRAVLKAVGGEEAVRGRRPIQTVLILILLVVAAGLLMAFLARARRRGRQSRLTVIGLAIGLFGFVLETISLHQLDQYSTLYWLLWYAGIALATIGVVGTCLAPRGAFSPSEPSSHARYAIDSNRRSRRA